MYSAAFFEFSHDSCNQKDILNVSQFKTSGLHCVLFFDFQLNSKKEDDVLRFYLYSMQVTVIVASDRIAAFNLNIKLFSNWPDTIK